MSALHHGRFQAADAAGRLVYTAAAVEHPLPGWPEPSAGATVTDLIPAQRQPDGAARTTPEGVFR